MATAEIRKAGTTLETKDWIAAITTVRHLTLQEKVVNFLLCAYGFLLLSSTVIIFFQGFHAWGFSLDSHLLNWLGGVTIGEIGGLLLLTFRAIFGNDSRKNGQ
jgi:hypothetical protein